MDRVLAALIGPLVLFLPFSCGGGSTPQPGPIQLPYRLVIVADHPLGPPYYKCGGRAEGPHVDASWTVTCANSSNYEPGECVKGSRTAIVSDYSSWAACP